jgi:DNA-directed RNA polymerase specialized sigma24 family protein
MRSFDTAADPSRKVEKLDNRNHSMAGLKEFRRRHARKAPKTGTGPDGEAAKMASRILHGRLGRRTIHAISVFSFRDPDGDEPRMTLAVDLLEVIEKLPPEEGEAVELLFFHGYSQPEAGEILGVH